MQRQMGGDHSHIPAWGGDPLADPKRSNSGGVGDGKRVEGVEVEVKRGEDQKASENTGTERGEQRGAGAVITRL